MEDSAPPSSPSSILDPPSSILRAVLWAIFLACSWTWCIGMFLPVLLVRDYGVWGWVVFAVPNVIGAAAMGWTVRDAEHSRRLVGAHRLAADSFSWVTIAFQMFILLWFLFQMAGIKQLLGGL